MKEGGEKKKSMNLTDVKFMLNVQWGWGKGDESEGHITKKIKIKNQLYSRAALCGLCVI